MMSIGHRFAGVFIIGGKSGCIDNIMSVSNQWNGIWTGMWNGMWNGMME